MVRRSELGLANSNGKCVVNQDSLFESNFMRFSNITGRLNGINRK